MKEAIVAIIIAVLFVVGLVYASPYGSQHEPMYWLVWAYQNLGWDL